MLETFVALAFAHIVADFLMQTRRMVASKGDPRFLGLHVACHLGMTVVALGQVAAGPLAVIALTHFAIDAAKARLGPGFGWFMLDQAAHLSVVAVVAALWPALWAGSAWSWGGWLPDPVTGLVLPAFVVVGAFVASLQGARFAGAALMREIGVAPPDGSNADAALWIGFGERFLTVAFTLAGRLEAVALIVAAKAIVAVRSGATRAEGEAVMVSTLFGIAWATAIGALAAAALAGLRS